jgi:hypothetical protein
MKPWEDQRIAQSIFVEQALEVAAVYTAFANDLALLIMPGDDDPSRLLREDAVRAREIAQQWLDYAEALKEAPDAGG